MNKSIITLSSVMVLIVASNNFINANHDNTTINKLTNKSIINENITSLINNQYDYLSKSDWITNQSTADNKFYSYDTSALKDYTFTNARNTFLVNESGELIYNKDVIIPIKEHLNIANTKQEMEFNKSIAIIKDSYNPYSKSEYDKSYFTGDNSNWQYLQLGGIEKHIDISNVQGGTKIENSNNLSETLGLYYIAKAVRENKITKAIANDLGQYFISHSTLKAKIDNNDLINNIINVIANNTDIFQLISKLSLVNNDVNYAIIYIFDNKNNLINVNYKKFDNTNIEKNINYRFNDWYSGFNSQNSVTSDTYTLLKWSDYVKDWDTFARVFSTFHFDKKSLLQVSASYGEINAATLVSDTKNINAYRGTDNNNILFTVNINWGSWYIGNHIKVEFNVWHDDNNIYFKWFLNEDSHWAYNLYADIFLNNVSFEI